VARAGFTAISSGKITFGKDGRWYCDGEAIPNAAICRLYSRTLIVEPDGRARLQLGEDRAEVHLEDTPWVVVGVDGDPRRGFTLTLNDDSQEPLDAASLRVGADNVLYCCVKRGPHEARFLRPAYYALMRFIETAPDGSFVLPLPGRTILLGTRR